MLRTSILSLLIVLFSGVVYSQSILESQELELENQHLETLRSFEESFSIQSSANSLRLGVLEADSLALVALYNASGGASWSRRDNWLSGPVPSWYGVIVSGDRVIRLNLGSFRDSQNDWLSVGLTGQIPEEITNLNALQYLDLSNNRLEGPLPASIGDMDELGGLILFNNDLDGELPSTLGQLSKLEFLSLGENDFSGEIPSSLGNLSELRYLYLFANRISGTIVNRISELRNLEVLSLHSNTLNSAIPSGIGELSGLTHLYLNDNILSGAIPKEVGNLIKLRYLYLNNNQLDGELISDFGNLTELRGLDLSRNAFTGSFLSDFSRLSKVRSISLHSNSLTGTLPDIFEQNPELRLLSVGFNFLEGQLPPSIATLENLITLEIAENDFSGTIPDFLDRLVHLKYLDLSGNRFSGTIPQGLGSFPDIQLLLLNRNKLRGIVPFEVARAGAQSENGAGCSFIGNYTSLCIPDDQLYLDLGLDPICGLQLRSDCASLEDLFEITFNVSDGGTISTADTATVALGDSLKVEFISDPGFIVSQVIIDGVDLGRIFDYTFRNVEDNHQVDVLFVSTVDSENDIPNEDSLIDVYPNPVNTEVRIDLNSKRPFNYRLFDILGKVLREGDLNVGSFMLDLSEIPRGSYYIVLKFSDETSVIRPISLVK